MEGQKQTLISRSKSKYTPAQRVAPAVLLKPPLEASPEQMSKNCELKVSLKMHGLSQGNSEIMAVIKYRVLDRVTQVIK